MTIKELKAKFDLKTIKLVKPNKDTAWVANIIGPNNVEVVAWVTKATPLNDQGRPVVNDKSEVNFREGKFFIGVFNAGIDSFEI
jgi:hypothetical protein